MKVFYIMIVAPIVAGFAGTTLGIILGAKGLGILLGMLMFGLITIIPLELCGADEGDTHGV